MDLFFGAACASICAFWITNDKKKVLSNLRLHQAWTFPALVCAMFAIVHLSQIQPASAVVVPNETITVAKNESVKPNRLTGVYKLFPFSRTFKSLVLGYYFANASLGEKVVTHPAIMRHMALPPVNMCPKKVLVDVKNESNIIKFSLFDPSNVCSSSKYMNWPLIMQDLSKHLGPIFVPTYELPYLDNKRCFFSASGKDLYKCTNVSFSQATIYGLGQQTLAVMHAYLLSLGVPPPVLRQLFGNLNHLTTVASSKIPSWNSVTIEEAKVELRKAFGKLSHVPLLVMGHTEDTSGAISGQKTECFYVKDGEGEKSHEEVSEHTDELLRKTIPVLLKAVQGPKKVPALSLSLTDNNCSIPRGSVIQSIDFSGVRAHPGMTYDAALSTAVKINGDLCAVAQVAPLSDAEIMMKDDGLGRKALAVINGLAPLAKNISKSTSKSPVLSGAILALSAQAPEEFIEVLNGEVLKSLTQVALIDVSSCTSIVDKRPVGVVISNLPAAKMFCNRIPNIDCSNVAYGRAAFLVRDIPSEKECIFTAVPRKHGPVPPKPVHTPQNLTYIPPTAPPYRTGASSSHLPMQSQLFPHLFSCFPAKATVKLANGHRVSMKDLRIGDMVEVSANTFSPVLLFTHALESITTRMTVIESDSGKIVSSPTHYLHVNGNLVLAERTKPGDFIVVQHMGDLRHEIVTKVTVKLMTGLYNPQTKSGNILVQYGDNAAVLASAYTSALSPFLAHLLMAPLRWTHTFFGVTLPCISGFFPGTRFVENQKRASVGGSSSITDTIFKLGTV